MLHPRPQVTGPACWVAAPDAGRAEEALPALPDLLLSLQPRQQLASETFLFTQTATCVLHYECMRSKH